VSAVIAGVTPGAGGRRFAGDVFVAAAGAWSAALLAEAGVSLAVRPVRGQIALLRPPAPLFSHVLWRGPRYLVPRADGRVLAGATEEEAGFAAHPTAAGVDGLLHLAFDLVPALRDAPFERAWAGLRPGSADGLPYLGAAPGFDNLYIAAGHFRAGFELSAGTARVMAQLILGEEPEVPLEAFRPDRS
jgi:glycine oxidase